MHRIIIKEPEQLLAGLGLALASDTAWKITGLPAWSEQAGGLFAWLEHYHWGIISLISATYSKKYRSLYQGYGITLIGTESGQTFPFAYGSPHFLESTLIGLGLGAILAYRLNTLRKKRRA